MIKRMKSSERQIVCPICGISVSADNLSRHIAQKASMERRGNLQELKKHYNYKMQCQTTK